MIKVQILNEIKNFMGMSGQGWYEFINILIIISLVRYKELEINNWIKGFWDTI